ncbi:MAG: hypothetical protein WCK42_03000 [Myxococcaceae bacterium]
MFKNLLVFSFVSMFSHAQSGRAPVGFYLLPLFQPVPTYVPAPPQNHGNLIVNYIPNELGIEEFTQIFAEFGEIENIRIIFDRVTGLSKGYGFVKFRHKEDALRAIRGLNGFEVYGKRLKVSFAQGPSRTS